MEIIFVKVVITLSALLSITALIFNFMNELESKGKPVICPRVIIALSFSSILLFFTSFLFIVFGHPDLPLDLVLVGFFVLSAGYYCSNMSIMSAREKIMLSRKGLTLSLATISFVVLIFYFNIIITPYLLN